MKKNSNRSVADEVYFDIPFEEEAGSLQTGRNILARIVNLLKGTSLMRSKDQISRLGSLVQPHLINFPEHTYRLFLKHAVAYNFRKFLEGSVLLTLSSITKTSKLITSFFPIKPNSFHFRDIRMPVIHDSHF